MVFPAMLWDGTAKQSGGEERGRTFGRASAARQGVTAPCAACAASPYLPSHQREGIFSSIS